MSKEVLPEDFPLSPRYGLPECIHNIQEEGWKLSRLDFLLTLAESLSSMCGVVEPATRGRPTKSPRPSRLLGRCFPYMVPGTSKKKPTRRCVVCCANGRRKESSYWCSNCEKVLCVVPCFQVYYRDKNLKIKIKTNFAIIVSKSCIP